MFHTVTPQLNEELSAHNMRLLLPSDVDAPSTEAITRLVGSVVNQAQTWEWGEQARSAWSARRIRFVCSKCGDPQTFLTLTEEPRVRQDHADLGVTILVNDDGEISVPLANWYAVSRWCEAMGFKLPSQDHVGSLNGERQYFPQVPLISMTPVGAGSLRQVQPGQIVWTADEGADQFHRGTFDLGNLASAQEAFANCCYRILPMLVKTDE